VLEARLILEIMVFVLGAVAAGLVALMVTPAVGRQAARRAQARLIAALPANRSEVEAEKDQLRARFAMNQRRLESAIGRLNEKLAARMVEANQQREQMASLARREAELSTLRSDLERRVAELTTGVERAEHRLSAANAELVLREERLAARAAEASHLKTNLAIRDLLTEEQRLELVARDTAIGNLHDALAALQTTVTAAAAARDDLTADLAITGRTVTDRDEHIRLLEGARAVLEAERLERMAEIERRGEEIAALRTALADATAGDQRGGLEQAVASLRAENAELRRASGAEWESERQENLRLRERLNEIAGHVVRMADTFAARTVVARANGANGHGAARETSSVPAQISREGATPARRDAVSLGARLRALQRTGTRH
jgi:chromosome segregation ATPase